MKRHRVKNLALFSIVIAVSCISILTGSDKKPLILQEMSWPEISDYLKTCDMAILPLGSTEQHGPHMPLGTDYFEALEISKRISLKTGVIIVPVLLAGYSKHHTGFPGTLSLKPETMEEVLFETAESLIKYGFRRFMFFNYHGGNQVMEDTVIHRINHTTGAFATKIGIGAPFYKSEEEAAPFDWHAGISETSIMLYLKPELVNMNRAEKPKMTFSPRMRNLQELSTRYPQMLSLWSTLMGLPAGTGKQGASHQISDNGIWSLGDPRTASRERGEGIVDDMVDGAVKFIEGWKQLSD